MLAKTPPLGWNSWNTFGGDIHEELVRATADAFVNEGLKEAGYEYVCIDDIWEADERENGRLIWDAKKFPQGIPALADYVHQQGLKFGIYSCAGTHTCAGKPASYGYEEDDAQTFAEWGVDFLKYDFCYKPPGTDGPTLYRRMGQALRMTGRPILFSVCEWGGHKPWKWAAGVGAHMWRTTGDIEDSWESILRIGFEQQAELHPYAGPGHWNDPDMLVVGMCNKGNAARGGCTEAEYRSHFALWCLLAAPLMIGCDVRSMNAATRTLLLNRELLSVNQDPLGRQGFRLGWNGHAGERQETWAKPLLDGSVAVGLFNLGAHTQRINVAWEALGVHDRRACRVRDLFAGEELGEHTRGFSMHVGSHDAAVVRVSPVGGAR
jgi:alpha-galactosidase